MKKLLKYLSLDFFCVLYVPSENANDRRSGSEIRISECVNGTFKSVFPSDAGRRTSKRKTGRDQEIVKAVCQAGTNRLFVVWNREEAQKYLEKAFNKFEKTDLNFSELGPEVYEVSSWVRILFPAFSDHSFPATVRYFTGSDANDPAAALGAVFTGILEYLARMELQRLAVLIRFLHHSPLPEKTLIHKILEYLKEHPVPDVRNPRLLQPMLPSNKIGSVPAGQYHDSIERVKPEEIREIFERGGLLQNHLIQYEDRPEQLKLSLNIAEAFNTSSVLLAEAGTGTGKSLAYLAPAILWSLKNYAQGETVVISTHTKNLQDQLFYKDLPLLEKIFDGRFSAVLLKGRSNYLCLRKWKAIMTEPAFYLTPAERESVLPLLFWLDLTQTGDISECGGFNMDQQPALWSKLASESGDCPAQKCAHFNDCFVKRARDEARRANLTVINHALLFSDILAENSIVGSYHNLILDEAHHIEKVAQNYLGMEFSPWVVKNFTGRLYERDKIETGLLIQIRQKLKSAGVSDFDRQSMTVALDKATEACVQLWQSTQTLFQSLALESHRKKSLPPPDDRYNRSTSSSNSRSKIRYMGADSVFQNTSGDNRGFIEACNGLKSALQSVLQITASWNERDMDSAEEYRLQILARVDMIDDIMKTFAFITEANDANFVYWYELPAHERSIDLRFYSAPLNIAETLPKVLFERLNTCILSSATLSVAGQFDYLKKRLGLNALVHQPVHAVAVDSPFNYPEQSRVLVAGFLPDPSHPSFTNAVSDLLSEILAAHKRGTLVLFTSYALMQACYYALREPLYRAGLTLLCQGQDASRTHLTRRFREDHTSVLFGTDSFWEGVDVPGEALEMLVITKLPFEVPSDPLVVAKMERIQSEGGNPFFDYSVPEAVIRFRQGFGRLIRHKNDRGVVIIMDNRLSTKAYGKLFINSLPTTVQRIAEKEQLLQSLGSFF